MKKGQRESPGKDFWSKAKFAVNASREATDFILKYLDEAFGEVDRVEADDTTPSPDRARVVGLTDRRESAESLGRKLEIKRLQLEVVQGIRNHLSRIVKELELEREMHVLAANSLVQQRRVQPIILPPEILAKIFDILYDEERHTQMVGLPKSSRMDTAYYDIPAQVVVYNKCTVTGLLGSHLFTDDWKRVVLRCAPLILTDGQQNRLFHGQFSKDRFRFIQLPDLRPYPRYHSLTHIALENISLYVEDVGSIIIMLDGLPAQTPAVQKLKGVLTLPGKRVHLYIVNRGDNKSTKDFSPIPRRILEGLNDTLHSVDILDVPPIILPPDVTPRSYPDAYDWAPFENISIARSDLKLARLPLPFIKGLAPILSNLGRLTLWIPSHIENLSTVLSALRSLPGSLNELCLYETKRGLRRFSFIEEDYEPLEFPDLQELSFLDFHADLEVVQAVSSLLDCPSLKTLKFDTWNAKVEEYYSVDLISWMDTQYSSVDHLSIICEVHQAAYTGKKIFKALSTPASGGIGLFPRLNEIEISVQREEDLMSIEDLVRTRFVADAIPNIIAVVIWTMLQQGEMEVGFVEHGVLDSYVKRLRGIVPRVEVKELRRPFEVNGY